MKEEIKEILDYIKKWSGISEIPMLVKLEDYITNLQEENERLNKEHKAIKKYVHNHTITYIDNGIECCKPDEYFNISWVENMLCGNFENLETLFEGEDEPVYECMDCGCSFEEPFEGSCPRCHSGDICNGLGEEKE